MKSLNKHDDDHRWWWRSAHQHFFDFFIFSQGFCASRGWTLPLAFFKYLVRVTVRAQEMPAPLCPWSNVDWMEITSFVLRAAFESSHSCAMQHRQGKKPHRDDLNLSWPNYWSCLKVLAKHLPVLPLMDAKLEYQAYGAARRGGLSKLVNQLPALIGMIYFCARAMPRYVYPAIK